MERAGFVSVKRYSPDESEDKNLRGIESHGRHIPEEFNKLESMVLEGTKPDVVQPDAQPVLPALSRRIQ